ncbi:uncharacterized protein DEA37_0014171 [Paragonimus westermani]|uniref:Uncharacterized protein n=1 Tax=Paragonimus westermani TaxID=34504 RepID=A0A5J4NBX1_9TREM|nr:uncharacterized protein DEA37_0014171 [Paragonimus westermani]
MLLFEGEPVLFFLFLFSVLGLLIGGCMWGSGEDQGNRAKMIGGIALFTIGCATTVVFFAIFTYKRIRKRKKRKREIERILQFQESAAVDVTEPEAVTNTVSSGLAVRKSNSQRSQAYENKAADLKDTVGNF